MKNHLFNPWSHYWVKNLNYLGFRELQVWFTGTYLASVQLCRQVLSLLLYH